MKTSFAILAVASMLVASAPHASAAPPSSNMPSEGASCTVVSGSNKGKTGKMSDDGWCQGSWGGTECVDEQGKNNGKCRSAAKAPIVQRGSLTAPTLATRALR